MDQHKWPGDSGALNLERCGGNRQRRRPGPPVGKPVLPAFVEIAEQHGVPTSAFTREQFAELMKRILETAEINRRVGVLGALPEELTVAIATNHFPAALRDRPKTELLRIWERGRKTALFVTHQIDEAVFLSDRVLVFARRPSRLQEIVSIDLPRPWELSLKRTPEFVRYVDHIWQLIEEEVRESVLHPGI